MPGEGNVAAVIDADFRYDIGAAAAADGFAENFEGRGRHIVVPLSVTLSIRS